METFAVAATHAVATSSSPADRVAQATPSSAEPHVDRWPGWARLAILLGGSAALWAGIAWVAFRILKLG